MTTSERTVDRENGEVPAQPKYDRLWTRLHTGPYLLPSLGIVGFVVAWELVGQAINPVLFATPGRVLAAYPELISSGELPRAFLITLHTLTVGYLVSAVIGIVLGLIIGQFELVRSLIDPYVEAVYATPRVILVPLTIVWFGIGFSARAFLVFIGTFVPILINTSAGVRNTDPALLEVGRSFGANDRELLRHIILPGAVPYIAAGLRIGIGRALIGVVVAEMFLQLTGLGGMIITYGTFFKTDKMLAGVLVLSVMGIVLMWATTWFERWISPWRVSADR